MVYAWHEETRPAREERVAGVPFEARLRRWGDRRGWLLLVLDRLGGGYGMGLRKKVMKSGGGGKRQLEGKLQVH